MMNKSRLVVCGLVLSAFVTVEGAFALPQPSGTPTASYLVPMENSPKNDRVSFSIPEAKFFRAKVPLMNGENIDKLELRYTLPPELTGNSPVLRVRLQSKFPMKSLEAKPKDSFKFIAKGVMVQGPCYWSDEKPEDKNASKCPETLNANDEAVFAPVTANCEYLVEKDRPFTTCQVGYLNLFDKEEIQDRLPKIEALLKAKYPNDPQKVRDIYQVAVSWNHEAVGVFTIPFE